MRKNNQLNKIAKKLKVDADQLVKMVVYNHEINHLIPKKRLKKVDLEISLESRLLIRKFAEALKIDEDAVIGSLLIDYIERVKEEKKLKEK